MKSKLIIPHLGSEFTVGADAGPNANPVGLICAANENRFTASHYSEALTAYTVGWRDTENVDAILARLAPEVPVSRRFEFKNAVNAEAFLSETDDIRAIGDSFKRVAYKGTTTNEKTLNKGLTIRIDHDDCEDLEAEVQRAVGRLMGRLARNELRRLIVVLEANDTTSAIVFSASTQPDGLIRAALAASADVSGVRPNVVLFGEAAWDLRLDAYEGSTAPAAAARAGKTLQELAGYFMVDLVDVVKARYQSSATAKSKIVPSTVYAYSAYAGAGKDDPSAIKRFVSSGRGGQRYGVYRQEYEKFTDVSVECYSNLVCTGVGIVSRTVTAS
ncbi:MAG: hypothetical protein HZA93_23830 [Verrucomicrobia bacterium]|nr:hypothetical protein [Verrucomicrobiota bacterium]